MGFFDNLAKAYSPNTYDRFHMASELEKFKADPSYTPDPSTFADPVTGIAVAEKIKSLRDFASQQAAAPDIARINEFRMDPRFQDPASLAEIQKNPAEAVFGQDVPAMSGFSVAAKGKPGVTAPTANKYTSEALQNYASEVGNTLDAFRASQGDPEAIARLAQNKDLAISFKDTSMGAENYGKMRTAEDARTQQANAAKAVARLDAATYGDANTSPSMAVRRAIAEESKNYTDPGALALLEKFGKDVDQQWANQEYKRTERTIGTGGATKKIVEITDPLGKFVKTEEVASHPRVASGGDIDPTKQLLSVSWIGADGTPQAARVERGDLPTLKASLEAQGVKEIETVDGKRASRTETLIKPAKSKASILGPRPGGTPTKPAGGYTYVNGKMVPN